MIIKIILTDDDEWSKQYVSDHKEDTIRFSFNELKNMLIFKDEDELLLTTIKLEVIKFVVQNDLNLVVCGNKDEIEIEELKYECKCRNSYNKRIKHNIQYEFEIY